MPCKDGKKCLIEIRNDSKFKNVPVIMFTTSSHYKDIEDTFNSGANLYVCKSDFFENEVSILKKIFMDGWNHTLKNVSMENFVWKN